MKILDLDIVNCRYNNILRTIELNLSSKQYFSFLNVNSYIVVKAMKDLMLKEYLKSFSSLFADGAGINFSSKFLYGKDGSQERINGTDLYYKILELAQKKHFKVFFFGGGQKAVSILKNNLMKLYPSLLIGGIIQRDLNLDEQILQKINSSNSDILFLGLGTPHQEKWIATFGQKCNIPIQIAVGSGIDFLSGTYKRAPKFIRTVGLEWLFRLFLEPKRLWKRYLIGIPHFIFLIIKQKFSSEK